jgi:sporulation protein YlmC with PRC-barrel domain
MLARIATGYALCLIALSGLASGCALAQSQEPATADAPPQPPSVAAPLPPGQANSDWRASKLLGETVINTLDQTVGKVDDMIVDADGKIVAVVVRVGGFLGLGEQSVPIAYRDLLIDRDENDKLTIKTTLSQTAIEQAASRDEAIGSER